MESNWLIIETWNKQSNPPCDKLCGTSKVSLHQFFVSLKDEKLSEALLRSSYPIISVDDYVTVTMLQSSSASLSQNDNPSLKVLLALGSHHQITQLLEMKSLTQKSSRILHHSNDHRSSTLNYLDGIDKIEHMVEMEIVSIRGLHREMENCFVSYDFPYQKTATGEIKDTTFKIKLNHKLEHNFVLSSNQSMQDMFIRNQDIQHVTFMLFPNHVDWNSQRKPLAKAKLSLSKLFSCIQTQHGDRINFQKLQLELFDEQTRNIGTLELTLKYEIRLLNNSESAWKRKSCVSLSIFKLCGLKSGAKMLLKRNSMNGLNCYVKYHLSFYDKFFGTSHIMHQSFSPCSSLHENIELPLILQHQQSRQQSLAQALEDGRLTVQLYCILPCNQSNNGDSSRDVLIGEVIYPTRYLLSHVTGYRNWFAIKYFSTIHNKEIISGGMEIEMKFVNQCDREEVINVGRGFGWHPRVNVDLSAENWLSPSNGFDEQKCCFRLEIKRLKFTRNSIEDLFGENEDYDARKEKVVYARYKFYNRAAVCTKAVKINESIDEMHCGMDHIDLYKLHSSASLAWYLREERFEIQFWIRCYDDNDDRMFVDENSKLIGSCYIDLSELSKSPSFSHTICDSYCLFKMGANEICDSKACLLISFNQSADSSEVCFGREVMSRDIDQSKDIGSDNSKKEKMMTSNETQMNDAKDDDADIISVSIQIEEALHIKSMLQTNDGVSSFYVSYELDANNFTTTLVTSSAKFVWNFQREEKMSKHVLKSRNIEFKLWRCMGEVIGREKDILIGVAIVDTSPLFSGMRQLNGWYHLLDFNRQPVGELKVGIIPQALISPSRATKYFKKIDFLQPINLEYTSFQSNGLQKNRDTLEGTSKTMLVDRLKEKLNDLDNITKLLSSKSTRSGNEKCTNSNQPAEVFNNVKLNLVTNQVPENITTDRSVSGDSGNVNMQVDINEKSFDNVLHDTFNSVTYNVQSNDGDEDRTLDENCGSIDDSKSESSSDESLFRVDMHRNSSDGVSTPIINTPPMVISGNAFCDNKQNEIETSFSGKMNSKSPSEDFSSDNTSDKSFESHRSDIQNFHQDDVGMVSLDDDVNVSPRDDDAPIEHHPRDDDAPIKYGPRDRLTDDCKTNEMRVSPISYSSIAQASLPNFFMKTEELADSMRALRLAANFKYSPRSSSSTDSSVTTPSLSTNREEKRRCFDEQHHKVQEQIKDHLPISDNEMERIKNIFLSKNSSLD